jgi:hypothetical protein
LCEEGGQGDQGQLTHAQKSEERKAKRRKKSARDECAAAKKRADAAARAEVCGPDETFGCSRCGRSFMTAGALAAHIANQCGASTRRRRAAKSKRRTVDDFRTQFADAAENELQSDRRELAYVTVKQALLPDNVKLERDEAGDIVVSAVRGTAAFHLGVGYTLRRVGRTEVQHDDMDVQMTLQEAMDAEGEHMDHVDFNCDCVDFVFERPPPPLPPHGWARKALRRTLKPRFTDGQKAFLDSHFNRGLKGGERAREKKVSKLMATKFARQLGDDGKSLVLKLAQIRGYFSRKAAALKRNAVEASLRDDDDVDECADVGPADHDVAEYGKLTVRELKEALEVHEAPTRGLKADLVARLDAIDAAVAAIDAARARDGAIDATDASPPAP